MNLRHLRNFWTVARLGGVVRAAERLDVTPQTVSGQVRQLEEELGATLFRPAGRGLELTEAGRMALSYADEILQLSDEMKSVLASRQPQLLLRVGITDVVPKTIGHRILAPAGELAEPVRLICREGPIEMLLGELALHRLDMVLADRPMPPGLSIRGHSHKLGESGLAFFVAGTTKARTREFPQCLDGASLLVPGADTTIRRQLDRWLNEQRLAPNIVGEFDDSALMKAFGQAGAGYFTGPVRLAEEICARYRVIRVGQTNEIRESYWLISAERRINHPAIKLIAESAQAWFASAVP